MQKVYGLHKYQGGALHSVVLVWSPARLVSSLWRTLFSALTANH